MTVARRGAAAARRARCAWRTSASSCRFRGWAARAACTGRSSRPRRSGPDPVVVKLYRRAPPRGASDVLADMVAWGRSLDPYERAWLHRITAWPLAVVYAGPGAAGIVMRDVTRRFAVPFVMPSGRRERVLLTLEHLLGADGYLELRGLGVRLDTARRAEVAERMSGGLAFLHRHGIAAGDIAPEQPAGRVRRTVTRDLASSTAIRWRSGGRVLCRACRRATGICRRRSASRPTPARPTHTSSGWSFCGCSPARTTRGCPSPICAMYRSKFAISSTARSATVAVNRPPAAEWQRALRGLLAEGSLNERYPGPAPAPRIPAARAGVPPVPAAAVAPAPTPARRALANPAPSRPVRPAAVPWLRHTVVALWIVAGTVALLVILSRLFAAAVPVPDSGRREPAALLLPGQPGSLPGRGRAPAGRPQRNRPAAVSMRRFRRRQSRGGFTPS